MWGKHRPVEDVEMTDSILAEKWSGHSAVEPPKEFNIQG